jgi:AraC family chitin signaling transcriptional activator
MFESNLQENVRWLFVLTMLCCYGFSRGQLLSEKGVPGIVNYTPAQYLNMGKIWNISSAPNGLVYMSCDQGLLEYDGFRWRNFKGSRGIHRAVKVKNDSIFFTGSDMDFGIWKRNTFGQLEYQSLYPFKEGNPLNEEFWQVHLQNENALFVSFFNLYLYNGEQLTKIPAPQKFSGSFSVDGEVYFADEKLGLFRLNRFILEKICDNPTSTSFQIKGVYNIEEGKLMVVTNEDGLWILEDGKLKPYNCHLSDLIKKAKVFSFESFGDQNIAYGTIQQGLIIADKNGNIIHHINKVKGLPNNTVLSMHWLPKGQLWLSMDYGLSRLILANAFSYVYDFMGNFGTGYTATLYGDLFYLGTNQGLYYSPWQALDNSNTFYNFRLIPGSEGQVWTIETIDRQVFVGHDKGLFQLKDNTLRKIVDNQGVWSVLAVKENLLAGTYNGILLLKKSGEEYILKGFLRDIQGSCTQLVFQEPNLLWINIPNFGIVRATLDEELQPVDRTNFDIDRFEGAYPTIHLLGDSLSIYTSSSCYFFNPITQLFEKRESKCLHIVAEGQLPGVYSGKPMDPRYDFFPVYNGFALRYRNTADANFQSSQKILLRSITAIGKDTSLLLQLGQKIPSSILKLNLEFAFPDKPDPILWYRFNARSEWVRTENPHLLSLSNLSPGKIQLYLRTIDTEGMTIEEEMVFYMDYPWYRRWYAYLIYLLILYFLIFLLKRWKNSVLEKQQIALSAENEKLKKDREVELNNQRLKIEQQQLALDNLELKQQLRGKTMELAIKAKLSEDKIRLLNALKDKLSNLQKNPSKSTLLWKEVQTLLDESDKDQDPMFEIQMNELHQAYFKKLKTQFPDLTQHDLRLCVYLKIALSTQEIAELMNVQPSSVYISRSRLRKKLNLSVEEDLFDFLNRI